MGDEYDTRDPHPTVPDWRPSIRAVLLDVGNTLVRADWQAILLPLAGSGIYPSPERLRSAEAQARRVFDSAPHDSAEPVDKDYWKLYFEFLTRELGIQDNSLGSELVARARCSANWTKLAPGTRKVLQQLRRQYVLGVISNSDGSIAPLLQSLGLDDLFTCIIDSGVVRVQKPDPAIFRLAASGVGLKEAQCCYVGDMYSVDYLGATSAGMQAILFDPAGNYAHLAIPRIASLRELADWLIT